MKCIVPLAGPDIYTEKYGLKPSYLVDNEPLLPKIINSRNWFGNRLMEEDIIFLIRDMEQLDELKNFLTSHFPKSKKVILPGFTKGALLTALSGVSLITDFLEPIVVDLVDIFFKSNIDPINYFNNDVKTVGLIPYFKSNNPGYSYLDLDNNGLLIRSREKQVISDNASAGVYFFRNISVFLSAVIYSINNEKEISYKDNLFLCPSFNGVIENGFNVYSFEVESYDDKSTIFK